MAVRRRGWRGAVVCLHITTSTVPNIDCHVKKQLSCHIAAMSIAVGAALVRPRQCWLQFRRRQRHRQW